MTGLTTGVDLRGTINRPCDRDDGWSVAVAIPWTTLAEAAPADAVPPPANGGDVTRAQRHLDVVDRKYAKRRDGQLLPETTGSGARRTRSTCTCPSAEAWCSSLTPRQDRGRSRLRRTERLSEVGAAPPVPSPAPAVVVDRPLHPGPRAARRRIDRGGKAWSSARPCKRAIRCTTFVPQDSPAPRSTFARAARCGSRSERGPFL